jgi:hypothetical protein
MNSNEEFDELARRKLEERQIPFQEADWQNARSRIDAQRGGGNKGMWITGAVALLLVGGLAWYGTGSSETAATVAANQNKEVPSVKQKPLSKTARAMQPHWWYQHQILQQLPPQKQSVRRPSATTP